MNTSRQFEAMVDLCCLLSNADHRRVVLFTQQHFVTDEKEGASTTSTPLSVLLSLFQWLHDQLVHTTTIVGEDKVNVQAVIHRKTSPPNILAQLDGGGSSNDKMMLSSRTKAGRRQSKETEVVTIPPGRTKRTLTTPHSPVTTSSMDSKLGGLPVSVVQAMGLVWHFLSMECTMIHQTRSSSGAATATTAATSGASPRKLREDVLSNAPAMQCLLEMVANDPYLVMISQKAHASDQLYHGNSINRDSKSNGSSHSSSPSPRRSPIVKSPQAASGSPDPTVAGWKRRRRRMDTSFSPGNQSEDGWSFTSTDEYDDSFVQPVRRSVGFGGTPSNNNNGRLLSSSVSGGSTMSDASEERSVQTARTFARVMESIDSPSLETPGGEAMEKNEILARLPLLSFCRIFSGRYEGHDKSCIDDEVDGGRPSYDHHHDDAEDDEMNGNPLLRTNFLLAQSGAIPLIARATSNAALVVIRQLMKTSTTTTCDTCDTFDAYVSWKFRTLTSLVDDACLLTDSNRVAFSTEGFVPETGAYMLINITTVLKALLVQGKLLEDTCWGDVTVACLRALTSLTHENDMAARDLQASTITLRDGPGVVPVPPCHCLSVIVDVLHHAASKDEDTTILCLNTLANVLESGGSWEVFSPLTVGDCDPETKSSSSSTSSTSSSFLTWLTRHIVVQTKSFQDALVESSFGSSLQDRHTERRLSKTENEALIVAGNAFIFLSHILVAARPTSTAYQDIMKELPGLLPATKIRFIQNTLKAFCNLYHFSVGALSLAIVAPVKKLLSELETLLDK
jgi:hypothetical protein